MRSQAVFEEFLTESEAPIPEALDLRCVLVAAPDLCPVLGEAFHPHASLPEARVFAMFGGLCHRHCNSDSPKAIAIAP